MLLGIKTSFNFNGSIEQAKEVQQGEDSYIINGTDKFKRIPLKETDFKKLNYKLSKPIFGWIKNKPLSSGKFEVEYNAQKYYMTYLDELELFNQVVLR